MRGPQGCSPTLPGLPVHELRERPELQGSVSHHSMTPALREQTWRRTDAGLLWRRAGGVGRRDGGQKEWAVALAGVPECHLLLHLHLTAPKSTF